MRLSKSTCFAINWLFANGYTVDKISEELKIDEANILKYIEKNNIQPSIELATKSEPVKSSKDLMIRQTKEKQTNNVSIMTREASAYNDSAKKKFKDKSIDNQKHIFRPND